MVWPLPLTAFEEYMLADDRPQWPMTFFLRLELRGPFDPDALHAALQAALERHPLLASSLGDGHRGRPQWVAAPRASPSIDCGDARSELDSPADRRIDLRRQTGLRVSVCTTSADQWTLWLQFHHACCDGLGAVQFVKDLLGFYRAHGRGAGIGDVSGHTRGRAIAPPRSARADAAAAIAAVAAGIVGALGAIEFFSHRPPSLSPANVQDGSTEDSAAPFPRWIKHRFTAEQTARLQEAARANRVTFNDLLLASLFLATDQWFAAHRPDARRQFLRVMVPMNLRTAADRAMPAANLVSMVNLDRRPSRYASRQKLLKSLSLEMAVIKRCRLGITLHHAVRIARFLGRLPRLVPKDRCLSTCVLSNLGEPRLIEPANASAALGDHRLEIAALDFLPPIRPLTSAAFGITTVDGSMTIDLHYDGSLSAELARIARPIRRAIGRIGRRLRGQTDSRRPRRSMARHRCATWPLASGMAWGYKC